MIVGAGCGCAQKSPLKSVPSVVWKRMDRRCDAGGTGSGLGSVHVIFSASNGLCGRESSSTKCCAIMIKLLVAAMLSAPAPAARPNTHRCCKDMNFIPLFALNYAGSCCFVRSIQSEKSVNCLLDNFML